MPPLGELPVERFQSFVMWRLNEGRDDQERAKLRATLWRPPADAPKESTENAASPWNASNENAALGALMKQLGG